MQTQTLECKPKNPGPYLHRPYLQRTGAHKKMPQNFGSGPYDGTPVNYKDLLESAQLAQSKTTEEVQDDTGDIDSDKGKETLEDVLRKILEHDGILHGANENMTDDARSMFGTLQQTYNAKVYNFDEGEHETKDTGWDGANENVKDATSVLEIQQQKDETLVYKTDKVEIINHEKSHLTDVAKHKDTFKSRPKTGASSAAMDVNQLSAENESSSEDILDLILVTPTRKSSLQTLFTIFVKLAAISTSSLLGLGISFIPYRLVSFFAVLFITIIFVFLACLLKMLQKFCDESSLRDARNV